MSKYCPAMTQIALAPLLAAVTALMRAGRWTTATELLQAATASTPSESLALSAALAEVTVDQDFSQQTDTAGPALAVLEEALADTPDATTSWDLAFLRLKKDYGSALSASNRTAGEAYAKRAAELHETAPDEARSGHAAFYQGVIADNLQESPEAAFTAFTTALELGERSGDDLLISLALRHLGDHAHTAGDLVLARAHWERSTELRQKVGHLLGALAQQTLLAVLARDEGNPEASRAIATEVNRWSHQVHIPFLQTQTAALLS
jgi:tetratricopeptide (TPR) repeat protein